VAVEGVEAVGVGVVAAGEEEEVGRVSSSSGVGFVARRERERDDGVLPEDEGKRSSEDRPERVLIRLWAGMDVVGSAGRVDDFCVGGMAAASDVRWHCRVQCCTITGQRRWRLVWRQHPFDGQQASGERNRTGWDGNERLAVTATATATATETDRRGHITRPTMAAAHRLRLHRADSWTRRALACFELPARRSTLGWR
jgi:hypothetical protein